MLIAQLVANVLNMGVKLWLKDGKICYRTPMGIDKRSFIKEFGARKEDIQELLEENKIYAVTSFAQQRLWFINQLTPSSPNYNIPILVRLKGTLDYNNLIQTFEYIIRRHEILRTTFQVLEGEPFQVISSENTFHLHKADLSYFNVNDQNRKLQGLFLTDINEPFALSSGPLLRIRVIKTGKEEYQLMMVLHHIIFDGWSIGIFIKEVEAIYNSIRNKTVLMLPELSIQYSDFAIWQRCWFQKGELEKQLKYWVAQLKDVPENLCFPTDSIRSNASFNYGKKKSFSISKELFTCLNYICQKEEVTLYMILLAAFEVLLGCYTGMEDFVIGSPIANRNKADTEYLIGFFVNTLVLRGNLVGNPSFQKLLMRVKETTLNAYSNQDFPFEILVNNLKLERNLSRNPLIQVMFTLQNAPLGEIKLIDLEVEMAEVNNDVNRFDIELHLWEHSDGMKGAIGYNSELFQEDTIEKLINHYMNIIKSVSHNIEQPILEIPIMTEDEKSLMKSLRERHNGNIDKQTLTYPRDNQSKLDMCYIEPQSETERFILEAWKEVLQIDQVGVQDNFFDIGGNSLLLIKVHIRLLKLFDNELTVTDLYRYPTIQSLGTYLTKGSDEKSSVQSAYSRAANRRDAVSAHRKRNQSSSLSIKEI